MKRVSLLVGTLSFPPRDVDIPAIPAIDIPTSQNHLPHYIRVLSTYYHSNNVTLLVLLFPTTSLSSLCINPPSTPTLNTPYIYWSQTQLLGSRTCESVIQGLFEAGSRMQHIDGRGRGEGVRYCDGGQISCLLPASVENTGQF